MCKHVRTVEALLVDDGAAGQGFIVLLVTHQGMHTQDGWKTARRLNEDGGNEGNEQRVRGRKQRERNAGKESIDLLIV